MADETNDEANDPMNDPEHANDSAAARGHGTHGKGDAREERVDPAAVEPDASRGTDAGRGTAGWGSEGAGGSVIDRRPPKDKPGA